MTEAEAKGKWCPMVRVSQSFGSSSGDRNQGLNRLNSFDCNCIASDCALWVVDTDTRFKTSPTGHCGMIRK